jgi:hypothetical protein
MKAKQRENISRSRPAFAKSQSGSDRRRGKVRRLFRRRAPRHDPLLAFNMSIFNFTDGWSRTFSKREYARFYA